ncbi:MAG TPA: CsbD family protein [Rhizomicrobium sp.]|nr:CsbD family protein [Rhizomicrobium sp.]
MDKDRIKGSADQAKGAAKDAAGKILHDQKLRAEGKIDKLKGKTESAIGGAKDALRDMDRKNKEEKKH